jgi:hypothetical protein
MEFIIGGVLLLIAAGVLWFVMGKRAGKLGVLEDTETSTAKDVQENFNSMTDSFGIGNFTLFTELKGEAVASSPLEAEMSKKPVVYYKATVTREYEVLKKSKDSDGNVTKRWVKGSEEVSSNENTATGFAVKDATGEVLIDIAGAERHTVKSHSSFEKVDDNANVGTKISIGGFSMSTGGGSTATKRTLGYKSEEVSIPVGVALYVLGDANDRSGKLMVSKPKDKKTPFIVSTKSEHELSAKLGSAVKGLKIGMIACAAIGGCLAGWGVISLIIG